MKKIILTLAIATSSLAFSQSQKALNKILDKIEAKSKKTVDASGFDLKGRKFVLIQDFDDHLERHILEINSDNTLTLIELIDDKESGQAVSNIFTGDYVRKKNAVSVRAEYLEQQKLPIPLSHNFYIMKNGDIWYLKDVNSGKRWIENQNILKKKDN